MDILEVLVLEHEKEFATKLLLPFSVDSITDFKIPVYRMEISPELVILIYKINSDISIHPSILDHIFPHLKSIIILSDGDIFKHWKFSAEITEKLNQYLDKLPSVLAITEEENREKLPEYILNNGLFLGPKSRMLILDLGKSDRVKQVWKLAMGDLMSIL
jgi:hypothetical protein